MKKLLSVCVLVSIFSCGEEAEEKNNPIPLIAPQKEIPNVNKAPEKDTVSIDSGKFKQLDSIQSYQKLMLPEGISIEWVERSNDGKSILKGDVVTLNYKGKFKDGKVFDSNDILKRPLAYYVGIGMSVKGWDLALPHLKTGDLARINIPSKYAYGKKGYGKLIPPDTDLVFEMQVTGKVKPEITPGKVEIFRVFDAGKEKEAKTGKEVAIHFYGWTIDGKMFDTSHRNGKPYSFLLGEGRAIAAWHETIPGMKIGDKILIRVPSEMGYGASGIPELVPPHTDLVYSIELIDVQD